MNEVIDFSTLKWVKTELDETLKQARQALEAFVENPDDSARVEELGAHLHQVYGTLQIVELYGAALLAEEMEQVAKALGEGKINQRDDAFEVLMRAILQLPDYLDRLASGHRDIPLVLLPLLNDLRAVRGENLLSESTMFSPNLDASLPEHVASNYIEGDIGQRARELRHKFQLNLLGFLRDQNPQDSLTVLNDIAITLSAMSARQDIRSYWWIGSGVIQALMDDSLQTNVALKVLLGRMDQVIKRLIDEGESALPETMITDMCKNLLFYAGQASYGNPTIAEIRATYNLDALLPNEEEITAAQESLTGQNSELLRTVASVVKEELKNLKATLDVLMRDAGVNSEDLKQFTDNLRSMSDTLGMLGLGAQRKVILAKSDDLQNVIDRNETPSDTALMEVASTLLLVDSTMSQMGQGHIANVSETAEDIDASLADSEFDQVKAVVLNEAITDLVRAKEAIIEFMAEGDSKLVGEATQLFGQVKGGLLLLDETRASTLVGAAVKYIKQNMSDMDNLPPGKDLESLADAVCGVEYYLEGLREHRLFGDNAIDLAEQRVAELGCTAENEEMDGGQDAANLADDFAGYETDSTEADFSLDAVSHNEPVAADDIPNVADEAEFVDVDQSEAREPVTDESAVVGAGQADAADSARYDNEMSEYPVLGEDTDEEILEIFIEEAEEEIASMGEQLPVWINNTEDTEALETVRRSFHTLKGSGRLVGAMRIGEFAWAFENMLNRVLDNTISPSPELMDILNQSHAALPTLVAQIQHGTPLDKPIAWLISAATALTKGETVPEIAGASEAVASEQEAVTEAADVDIDIVAVDVPETEQHVYAGMEPVLYEIYATETKNHFATIDDFLTSKTDKVTDELVRALHTMHGSASTASVDSISAVSARLEKYTKLLADADWALTDEGLSVLQEGRNTMGKLFEQLPGEIQEADGFTENLQYIDGLIKTLNEEIKATEAAAAEQQAEQEVVPDTFQLVNEDTVVDAVDDPYADYDQELLEIFLEESAEILERSDAALSDWKTDTSNTDALEQLQRELHTLKGGARMADLTETGNLAHALESVIITMVESGAVEVEGLDIIQSAHDQLGSEIEKISHRQPMNDNSDLVDRLNLLQVALAESGTVEQAEEQAEEEVVTDYGDPELVSIFIEEASDILENSENTMQLWKADTGNIEHMAALQRELHTLKGGARMADISSIGDLAHSVESLMVMLTDGELQPTPAVFTTLERAQDRLASMVVKLGDSKPLGSTADLLQQLEALRNGETVEVAEEAVSEAPQQPAMEEQQPNVEFRPQLRDTNELVRVKANLLNELVNNAGEVSIYRSRLEQQVGAYRFNLVEMDQTVLRLREQLRKLEIETEAQILFRYEKEIDETSSDFDPLEMDRYSNLQQLSRSLMESVADMSSIQNLLENITRESETLLLQQSRVNTELQEGLMRTRMVPFLGLAPRMRRIVRQTSEELGKNVELELSGAEGELDRTVVDRIIAPIEHMLRNAISHGIEKPKARKKLGKPETGTIRVTLEREASDIVLRLIDDGAGININSVRKKAIERGLMDADSDLSENDILQFILEAGFSTAQKITQVSGRGVGMDVVSSEVKQLGGSLHIASEEGVGTTFNIRLPFTLAINQALLIEACDETYAIPLSNIQGIVRIDQQALKNYYDDPASRFNYDNVEYEVRHLGSVLGSHKPNFDALPERVPVLLARAGDKAMALQVENLLGSREIVVKSVGPQISTVRGVSGATILGDGRVVMILDMAALLRSGYSAMTQVEEILQQPLKTENITVMVVDDSITVRKVTSRLLERNDMHVVTAKDGVDAVAKLHETVPDIMLLDIEMPRMDGFELATHVRNDERLRHVPIIMITSRTGDKHRQRATEIGVNAYLGKPFQEADLLDNIRALLRG